MSRILRVEIDLGGAAFDPPDTDHEAAAILRTIAERLESESVRLRERRLGQESYVMDSNGIRSCRWLVTDHVLPDPPAWE